jgi:hypothetical protein
MKSVNKLTIIISLIIFSTIYSIKTNSKRNTAPIISTPSQGPLSVPAFPINNVIANSQPVTGSFPTTPQNVNMTEVFATLFTDPTRSTYECPCKKTPEELNALKVNITEDGAVWAVPRKKPNYYEQKKLGWEASAYLIDFLDPVLQKIIVNEFDRIFKEAQKIAPLPNFLEPYSLQRILGLNGAFVTPREELVKRMTALSPKFKIEDWEASISVAQLESIIKEWAWHYDPIQQFPGKFIVDLFDFDGDGRLNGREFIIAAIMNNQKVVDGPKKCKNCMESIIEKFIDPIYLYLDCASKDSITAEQMWMGLQKLKRTTLGYDMFKCTLEAGKYRTSAINDFILKSHKIVEGRLSKLEFRLGVLQSYWDRHVDSNKVYLDDGRNMKNLRWVNNGEIDTVCERIKQHIELNKGV